MTQAQDGGKVVSLTHRPPLPPGNAPGTHLFFFLKVKVREAGVYSAMQLKEADCTLTP
jgi:hypothetical protein